MYSWINGKIDLITPKHNYNFYIKGEICNGTRKQLRQQQEGKQYKRL